VYCADISFVHNPCCSTHCLAQQHACCASSLALGDASCNSQQDAVSVLQFASRCKTSLTRASRAVEASTLYRSRLRKTQKPKDSADGRHLYVHVPTPTSFSDTPTTVRLCLRSKPPIHKCSACHQHALAKLPHVGGCTPSLRLLRPAVHYYIQMQTSQTRTRSSSPGHCPRRMYCQMLMELQTQQPMSGVRIFV
jgi:hypothetical protein